MHPTPPSAARPRPLTVIGLERNGLFGAGVVAAIIFVLGVILPAIAPALPKSGDVAQPGDVITLAGRARFTPAPGWQVSADSDPAQGGASVSSGGVEFAIQVHQTQGPLADLRPVLEKQLERLLRGVVFRNAGTFTTPAGLNGIGEDFSSARAEGFLYMLTNGRTDVIVVIDGPPGSLDAQTQALGAMIKSIEVAQ